MDQINAATIFYIFTLQYQKTVLFYMVGTYVYALAFERF